MTLDEKKTSLRQRNHERMRQRILAAALALFTSEGYDQTTMDTIAQQAEVGRATLFKYFPTKSSLLLPLSQQILFAELRPKVDARLAQQPTTAEALHYYFDLIGQRLRELSDVARALIKVIGMDEAEAAEHVPNFAATLQTILEYGQERGEVRRDIPAEMLSDYISFMYGKLLNHMVSADEIESYTSVIQMFLSFVETGMTSSHS